MCIHIFWIDFPLNIGEAFWNDFPLNIGEAYILRKRDASVGSSIYLQKTLIYLPIKKKRRICGFVCLPIYVPIYPFTDIHPRATLEEEEEEEDDDAGGRRRQEEVEMSLMKWIVPGADCALANWVQDFAGILLPP